MPTYEFRCPEGHEFEKFFRSISSAESIAACPTCGEAAERMMSATGFAFKGSGFYLTDYGKNAHRGEAPPTAAKDGADTSSVSSIESAKGDASGASDAGKAASKGSEGGAKSDAGESKPAPKPESKAAESKPAPAAPKPSSSE